jgi:hypothetical protein
MNISARSNEATWFPLFEFQDWLYQSYLVLAQPADEAAEAGATVAAKKWSIGALLCGQAFTAEGARYALSGTLRFPSGAELAIRAQGQLGLGDGPASFETTATATGDLAGMVSELVGWVFPELPITNGAARVSSVRGSIRAVRGIDKKPEIDPSGLPLGTVGQFVIAHPH